MRGQIALGSLTVSFYKKKGKNEYRKSCVLKNFVFTLYQDSKEISESTLFTNDYLISKIQRRKPKNLKTFETIENIEYKIKSLHGLTSYDLPLNINT